jgi:hypothetical protein
MEPRVERLPEKRYGPGPLAEHGRDPGEVHEVVASLGRMSLQPILHLFRSVEIASSGSDQTQESGPVSVQRTGFRKEPLRFRPPLRQIQRMTEDDLRVRIHLPRGVERNWLVKSDGQLEGSLRFRLVAVMS